MVVVEKEEKKMDKKKKKIGIVERGGKAICRALCGIEKRVRGVNSGGLAGVGDGVIFLVLAWGTFIETLGLCLLLLFGSDKEQYAGELKEIWCGVEEENSPGMQYVDVMI